MVIARLMLIIVEMITDDPEYSKYRHNVSEIAYLYLALKNKNHHHSILAQAMSNKLTSKNVSIYFTF